MITPRLKDFTSNRVVICRKIRVAFNSTSIAIVLAVSILTRPAKRNLRHVVASKLLSFKVTRKVY